MEAHPPVPAANLTIIRGKLCARLEAEGPRYGVARMVDLLILEVMTYFIALVISRAEWRLQQEACQKDAVAAGGSVVADADDGAERVGDLGAVPAAVATFEGRSGGGPGLLRSARDDGVGEGLLVAAKDVCGRREPVLARPFGPTRGPTTTTVGHSLRHLVEARWVFDVAFAKMELRAWAELRSIRYDIATMMDYCLE